MWTNLILEMKFKKISLSQEYFFKSLLSWIEWKMRDFSQNCWDTNDRKFPEFSPRFAKGMFLKNYRGVFVEIIWIFLKVCSEDSQFLVYMDKILQKITKFKEYSLKMKNDCQKIVGKFSKILENVSPAKQLFDVLIEVFLWYNLNYELWISNFREISTKSCLIYIFQRMWSNFQKIVGKFPKILENVSPGKQSFDVPIKVFLWYNLNFSQFLLWGFSILRVHAQNFPKNYQMQGKFPKKL